MMLSRRNFLIGSAASIAAAATASALPAHEILAAEVEPRFRLIYDIFVAPDWENAEPVVWSLRRRGYDLLTFPLSRGSMFRWRAIPLAEIISPEDMPVDFSLTPCTGSGQFSIVSKDRPKDGRSFVENFKWGDGRLEREGCFPLSVS